MKIKAFTCFPPIAKKSADPSKADRTCVAQTAVHSIISNCALNMNKERVTSRTKITLISVAFNKRLSACVEEEWFFFNKLIRISQSEPYHTYLLWSASMGIRHFHIPHNTPCLPPKFCIRLSSVSLGTTVIPRGNGKQRLCRFLGGKQGVLCGMWKWRYIKEPSNFSHPFQLSSNNRYRYSLQQSFTNIVLSRTFLGCSYSSSETTTKF